MSLTSLGHVDPAFWQGRRVFVTGHTGFKGGWLSLWLQQMGAELHGYSLAAPTQPSLFQTASVEREMASTIGDIRDGEALKRALLAHRPEVVIHMAAQPLVRHSYVDPIETYSTNVMGTAHLLEAVRASDTVRAVVNITTDKCYENREWVWGYREDEPMGGHDPYSSSKGCAELVASAYRRSFLASGSKALASVRAGNVIGGGDWAADRLVPDILRAFEGGRAVTLRNPHSTRPWQHVLEPLSGYLALAQCLAKDDGQSWAEGWNFGPRDEDARPVQWIVERMAKAWGEGARWEVDASPQPHEAHFLKLDISKAKARLGWQPRWNLDRALNAIIEWHRAWLDGQDMRVTCQRQIQDYVNSAADNNL
jgi:CDP-glucose 4,6-dehydratase